ncbi:MAG: type II toxin-antitoxin system VapC family toxin [Pirellulaceae bacterium]
MIEVFFDTSYAVALSVETDAHHLRALELSDRFESQAKVITTTAILFEIGNALARTRHRQTAAILLDAIGADANFEIVPITQDLYGEALDLYRSRVDKDWGLIDCASFVVMQGRGLTDALTADQHYEQAGFRALLRVSD